MMTISLRCVCYCLLCLPLVAQTESKDKKAPAATLKPQELKDFFKHSAEMREVLTYALALTEKNLTYTYASSDPAAGGMDCSGTLYHVLRKFGWANAPRQSNEMYQWAWDAGTFRAFNSNSLGTFEMKQLQPGDLMFWTNTTKGKPDRDPPITHVMMYLGKRLADGHPVMFGASDGRTYDHVARWGVSVFDVQLPPVGSAARFIGYAHLPAKSKRP
jgi:cell wall-associated NlpC family hydrolase